MYVVHWVTYSVCFVTKHGTTIMKYTYTDIFVNEHMYGRVISLIILRSLAHSPLPRTAVLQSFLFGRRTVGCVRCELSGLGFSCCKHCLLMISSVALMNHFLTTGLISSALARIHARYFERSVNPRRFAEICFKYFCMYTCTCLENLQQIVLSRTCHPISSVRPFVICSCLCI